jgi:hypothetical protein
VERPKNLGPVNSQAIEQDVGDKRKENQQVPSQAIGCEGGVNAPDQDGKQRCQCCKHKERVTETSMVSKITDGIAKGNENIQIWKQAAQPAPKNSPPSGLTMQDRRSHGSPKHDLSQ